MKLGDSASLTRSFDERAVAAYVRLGGAPVSDARVPEPLIGAMFSKLLGMELPGLGTNYLKQDTEFPKPARLGDKLEATVTITRLRPDKKLVDLETVCRDSAGETVAHGRALVYVADVDDVMDTT